MWVFSGGSENMHVVMPTEAGIQAFYNYLDPGLRRGDKRGAVAIPAGIL
jgi:hypothetical protein